MSDERAQIVDRLFDAYGEVARAARHYLSEWAAPLADDEEKVNAQYARMDALSKVLSDACDALRWVEADALALASIEMEKEDDDGD